jgi:hypothetical protein
MITLSTQKKEVVLMKKFIIILFAFILFAGFVGCGTVPEPQASE